MILLHKPVGITPAQAVGAYKLLFPQYSTIRLGVAGRLDPMAEGLLVLMVGDENKNQADYMGLDKTYYVEMILGASTDSHDVLGLPRLHDTDQELTSTTKIKEVLKAFTGKQQQSYPPYSAVRVNGKPLHWWARQNRLSEISIPTTARNFYSINFESASGWTGQHLFEYLSHNISLVEGDFRQSESILSWRGLIDCLPNGHRFKRVSFTVHCSSGSYIRTLVHDIGEELGCGATTIKIIRTKVGKWELKDAERLEIL